MAFGAGTITAMDALASPRVHAALPANQSGSRLVAPTNASPKQRETQPPLRRKFSLDRYYAAAQGKEGVELLRSLHGIASSRHRENSYDKARQMMFSFVDDADHDNTIVDLYTGKKLEGVTNLRLADRKRLTAEHAWPQSTGATEIAKSDLHSLFPVDFEVNNMRSANPFGSVDVARWASPAQQGVEELSLLGLDESGMKVFEPRASMRGDVARAQLYFFTRYFGDRPKRFNLEGFKHSLPTLLDWHRKDPPSEAERIRNGLVHRAQGNRNPFVDHPDYVGRIGFTPGMLRRAKKA